jgi:hypothetical protein
MTMDAAPSMLVFNEFPQELFIRVSGSDVVLLAPNRLKDDPDPRNVLPDPIELFARAVNQQMFPRMEPRSSPSSARILDRSTQLAQGEQTWRLRVEHAHASCLRILANLLYARDFESAVVQASQPSLQARRLDPAQLAYPPVQSSLPFAVEHEEVIRALRDRLIQVEFARQPDDATYEGLASTMELWCDLLLLGGYPPQGMHPREAGVLPEGPLLLDEVTIQLAFPEAFLTDEAAFNCLLNHLCHLDSSHNPVVRVRLR